MRLLTITLTIAMVSLVGFWSLLAYGDDWPQWAGPKRDSVWRERGIVETLPTGPPVRWRVPVAAGYAGPAVAAGKVYVTDYVRESGEPINSAGMQAELTGRERVLCLDAASGEVVWRHQYDCPYRVSYPGGPRATPTVVGGKVYAFGAMGNLSCLDAVTGQLLWARDLKKEYNTGAPLWGFAGHPLVEGQRLFCLVGGRGSVAVALDKDSGKELWRALPGSEPGYCAPTMIEAGGTKQLVIWDPQSIHGLDPQTGKVYWSENLEPSFGMSIAVPRQYGGYLYASGVGNAGLLLKLDQGAPGVGIVWRGDSRNGVYCVNSPPIIEDNVIYGVDNQGALRGVDLLTGKRLWETYAATTGSRRASYATAFLVQHEDRYFLFNERGELILARLKPDGYDELGRFKVLEPTNETSGRPVVWSHPAFANQSMYARNDKEIVCVSLAAK